MAGLGFALFVLPVLAGIVIAAFLSFGLRVRFLASYSVCIPLFGALGGWIGMDAPGPSSCGVGISVGAIAGFGVNRLTRLATE